MPLIHTTKGDLNESLLHRQDGAIDNKVETTSWTEYWQGGLGHKHVFDAQAAKSADGSSLCVAPGPCDALLIHRSVTMTLKQMPTSTGAVASFTK